MIELIELLENLGEEIAKLSKAIEGVEDLSRAQRAYKKYRHAKRKYHEMRSRWAHMKHPFQYQRIKILQRYIPKYLQIQSKLKIKFPNLLKLLNSYLNKKINNYLFEEDNIALRNLKLQRRKLLGKYYRLQAKIEMIKEARSKYTLQELIDQVIQIQKELIKNKKAQKRLEKRNFRRVRIEGRKRLSSSFLDFGIFTVLPNSREYNENRKGSLMLCMQGRTYLYFDFPQLWWISMVDAKGKNGRGAGSVFWNTYWFSKRTTSVSTKTKRKRLAKKRTTLRRMQRKYQVGIEAAKGKKTIIKVRRKRYKRRRKKNAKR